MARLKIPGVTHLLINLGQAMCGARWTVNTRDNFNVNQTITTCSACLKRHTLHKVTLRLKQ